MSLLCDNPTSVLIKRVLAFYDRHFATISVVIMLFYSALYFVVARNHMALSYYSFPVVSLHLFGGPFGGIVLYALLLYLRWWLQKSSSLYIERPKLVSSYNIPKPSMGNLVTALKAGLCSLVLNIGGYKLNIKRAINSPHLHYLDLFDEYERHIREDDCNNAVDILEELFNPETYVFAQSIIKEAYGELITHYVFWSEVKTVLIKPTSSKRLRLAVAYFLLEDYNSCIKKFELLTRSNEFSLREHLLYAIVLDLIVFCAEMLDKRWEILRLKIWEDVMGRALRKHISWHYPFGSMRAFTFESSNPVSSVLVLKESNSREEVNNEVVTNTRLGVHFREKSICQPPFSVKVLGFRDRFYHIMRHSHGKLLDDFSANTAKSAYAKVISVLAEIHRTFTSDLPRRDMKVLIHGRIQHATTKELSNLVTDNWEVLWSRIKGKWVFDKDAHPRNWLIGDSGVVVPIDNIDKGLVSQFFDLVKLLERPPLHQKGALCKYVLLKKYCEIIGTVFNSDFKVSYLSAVPIMALSHYTLQMDSGVDQVFLESASDALVKLQKKSVSLYSDAELISLENLRLGILGLLHTRSCNGAIN